MPLVTGKHLVEAVCELDEGNLAEVRRFMGQLLRVPVVESGAVMPDARPAGAATATIPVGGAIAVMNAILAAAHSADIRCSMHASLFRCGGSTAKMLDDLVASTRFGFGGRREELTPKQLRQIEYRADRRKDRQGIRKWEDGEEL
jgi:hypothetical protein